MYISFYQTNRAEIFLTASRIILAAVALCAIWLDPIENARHFVAAYSLLAGYLCYSIALALTVWRRERTRTRFAIVIHAFDMLVFAIFIFITGGPVSPFFAFFLFSLLVAAWRWQWRGVVFTAAIILSFEISMALYPEALSQDPEFNITHFIFRIGSFLFVAALLGYLGTYHKQHRARISAMASWPKTNFDEVDPLVRQILQHCSLFFTAPRSLLLWKDEEKPLLHTASWSKEQFHHSLEPLDSFGSLVAEPLAGKDFFCRDSFTPKPSVLQSSPTGFEQWQGTPLHPELQLRFSIKSVLSLDIQSESFSGRLFVLDKQDMSSDDLVLGKIIAHMASCSLDQFHRLKRLRQTATMEERIRLARDLHDGILQSLTSVILQLHTVHQLMENEPQTARQRLLDVQKLISSEQQNLRSHIQQLKPPYSSHPEWDVDLVQRLPELAQRIEHQWGLHVDIDVKLNESRLPWTLAKGVYFIIHEAMINAARHGKASSLKVGINSTDHQLQIDVTDNGRGFPFDGRYDHAHLTENNLGPVILRERVASLLGQLSIESAKTGTHLEITLPIPEVMN